MRVLFRYQKHLLTLVALVTLGLAYFMSQLSYDYDMEQLFPKNDPELEFHREVEAKFAHHQDYLILGIENHAGIFQGDFLIRLDSLAKKLATHPLVKEVNAPSNLRYHFRSPFGIQSLPFLHPHQRERYEEDSIFIHSYPDVVPKFLSRKHTAVCNFIFLTEALSAETKTEMRTFIDQQVASIGFDKHHLYGDIYAQDSYIKELEAEMYWLSGLSLIIILVILFLSFRSVAGVLIPITIVILTTIWTMGTMAVFGVAVNMMTVLVPTIVSIIALSDVIHVMNRFGENDGLSKREAIQETIKEMRSAILLTSLTTGLGFMTLSYSKLQPFIEFGLFTTIGVAYAYFFAIWVLPLLLDLAPLTNYQGRGNSLAKTIRKGYQFTHQKPRVVLRITALILLVSFAGMSKLSINAYLYEELSSKDSFSETLHFFETHFSGIRTFNLHLEVTDTSRTLLEEAMLSQIETLEKYLLEEYGLHDVYSIATQIKRANRVNQKGDPAAFVLPKNNAYLKFLSDQVLAETDELGLKSILSADHREARISGKMEDVGSAEVRERNRQLDAFIAAAFPENLMKVRLTGSTLLLDKSNKVITYQLMYGLLFAVAVVSILMGFLYKSVRITLIAILPNLLPLLMILGIIGWAGMGLKMSTVIVFTIAFGIAVDDTIHFLSRLRAELKKGLPVEDAIRLSYHSAGKAIFTTSLILILGFGVLLFSAFQTTFITGLLVSLALLFALFADLMLLPVLLELGYRNRESNISTDSGRKQYGGVRSS